MSHTIPQTLAQNPMWVYERNYQHLLRFLPIPLLQGEKQDFRTARQHGQVEFRVLDRDRYTLTLTAKQSFTGMSSVPDVEFSVRMYRDLQVAEVLSYQGFSRSLPDSTLSSARLLQCVGKRQANLLLRDWLDSLQLGNHTASTDEVHCVED